MDLSETLKTRVPIKLRIEFEAVCKAVGVLPSAKMRELIEAYARKHRDLLGEDVIIEITRPKGYDHGAFSVFTKLRDPDAMNINGDPIPFHIPDLPNRIMYAEQGYTAVVFNGNQPEIGGRFVNGEWRGRLYTNGIPEDENPTTVKAVAEALRINIMSRLNRGQ